MCCPVSSLTRSTDAPLAGSLTSLDGASLTASPLVLIEKSLKRNARRVAVTHAGDSTTYAELSVMAWDLVSRLHAAGVRRGDSVGILLGNTVEYLAADVALLRLGAAKVPLNQMLAAGEITYILEHSLASAVLITPALLERLAATANLPWAAEESATAVVLVTPGTGDRAAPVEQEIVLDETARAAIFYTGGTTGRSKGVVHTHASLAANLLSNVFEADIRDGEEMLLATPLSHAAGVFAQAGLARGATLILVERFVPAETVDLVDAGTVSWTYMVPTMLYRLLDYIAAGHTPTAQFATLVYGSAPITPRRLREAIDVLGPVLVQLYAQTECPNWGTTLSKADHRRARDEPGLLESSGRSSTMAAVRVVAEDGRQVTREAGEVCLTSPYLMQGYLDDPEATARTKRAGWVHTGDIGVMDDEGFLYLRDRRADMIITGGMNVYSTEVEATISQLAGVSQVAVIGVPHPDWGEAVMAYVVLAGDHDLDAQAVLDHCAPRIATYKRPKTVEFVDVIPTTPFGKPDKKALRARFWGEGDRQIS